MLAYNVSAGGLSNFTRKWTRNPLSAFEHLDFLLHRWES